VLLSQPQVLAGIQAGETGELHLWTINGPIALLVLFSLVHPSRAFAANPDQDTAA